MAEDDKGIGEEQGARRRSMLLTALYIAQEQHGWLRPQAIERVAQRFGMTPGQVYATASFYTLFKLAPVGRYRIQVCEGLSCYLVGGAEPLVEQIGRLLNLRPGETTPDGRFTLEVVECLASCGTAPALRVNDELYEHMTPEKVEELVERLRRA
ncbi:MAG: NAD(P)H-dependent oxidoreductase subunit E [Anaerolineae bacterium]